MIGRDFNDSAKTLAACVWSAFPIWGWLVAFMVIGYFIPAPCWWRHAASLAVETSRLACSIFPGNVFAMPISFQYLCWHHLQKSAAIDGIYEVIYWGAW